MQASHKMRIIWMAAQNIIDWVVCEQTLKYLHRGSDTEHTAEAIHRRDQFKTDGANAPAKQKRLKITAPQT